MKLTDEQRDDLLIAIGCSLLYQDAPGLITRHDPSKLLRALSVAIKRREVPEVRASSSGSGRDVANVQV